MLRMRTSRVLPRLVFSSLVAILLVGSAERRAMEARRTSVLFYATQSGKLAFDRADGGGNPFASALIELLAQPSLKLSELESGLAELTREKSSGFQQPEIVGCLPVNDWLIAPRSSGESRIALVLVYSDYSASGASSLPGAKTDSNRVSRALEAAGFEVETVVDPQQGELTGVVERFSARSSQSDVALIYATGHGTEVSRRAYLLPGYYPFERGVAALPELGVGVEDLLGQLKAKKVNLLFFGGCRTYGI